jgi:hypothetical protein
MLHVSYIYAECFCVILVKYFANSTRTQLAFQQGEGMGGRGKGAFDFNFLILKKHRTGQIFYVSFD